MPAGADPSDGRRLGLSDDGLRRFKRSGTWRPSLEQLDLRQGSYQATGAQPTGAAASNNTNTIAKITRAKISIGFRDVEPRDRAKRNSGTEPIHRNILLVFLLV